MSQITAAFSDAVHDSQFCFRRLLKAMSEPGTRVLLNRSKGFGTMQPGSAQVLLTLADNRTSVWLSKELAENETVTANIAFHISAPLTREAGASAFAVLAGHDQADTTDILNEFSHGTEEYPDQSTTLVIETDNFESGPVLTLGGPGIPGQRQVQLGSLSQPLLKKMQDNVSSFPLGLDMIFVAGEEVIAIPRSTTVEV